MRQLLMKVCVLLCLLGTWESRVAFAAEHLASADAKQARAVVQAQLDALRTDDAVAAFALAKPGIREQLGTPERFMAMVRAGYPMLIRPASTSFLEPALIDGDVAQGVRITDATGAVWLAVYRLQRQPDQSWRIGACEVSRRAGQVI